MLATIEVSEELAMSQCAYRQSSHLLVSVSDKLFAVIKELMIHVQMRKTQVNG
jgi:hypothetical protein